jgi:hypothetical protein
VSGAGGRAALERTVPPFDGRHLLVESVADEERVVEGEGVLGAVDVDHGGRPEDDAHVGVVELVDELLEVCDLGAGRERVKRGLQHTSEKTARWGTAEGGGRGGNDLPLTVDVHGAHGDVSRRVVAEKIQRAWGSKSITRSYRAHAAGTRLVE